MAKWLEFVDESDVGQLCHDAAGTECHAARDSRARVAGGSGLARGWRSPRGGGTPPGVAAADALTKQASTYESVLIENGLAADFIAQLQKAMNALRTSVDSRGIAVAARTRATTQLGVSIEIAVRCMTMMDAQLSKLLKSQQPALREWKNARRVTIKAVARQGAADVVPEMLATPELAKAA